MATKHFGYFLHRLKVGLQGSCYPIVEKLSCCFRISKLPKLLKIFSHYVAFNGGQVQFH